MSENEQIKKFKEAAKKAGCDESDNTLDKAFDKLEPKVEPKSEKKPGK